MSLLQHVLTVRDVLVAALIVGCLYGAHRLDWFEAEMEEDFVENPDSWTPPWARGRRS